MFLLGSGAPALAAGPGQRRGHRPARHPDVAVRPGHGWLGRGPRASGVAAEHGVVTVGVSPDEQKEKSAPGTPPPVWHGTGGRRLSEHPPLDNPVLYLAARKTIGVFLEWWVSAPVPGQTSMGCFLPAANKNEDVFFFAMP